LSQRQKIVLVLEQNDALTRSSQCQALVFFRVNDSLRLLRVGIRALEESEPELLFEHPAEGPIDQLHWDSSFFDILNQGAHVSGLVGDVQIDARSQGERARLLLGWNDAFIDERPEAAAFARDDPLETELLAQDFRKPLLGSVRGQVINLRVSGHDSQSA